MFGLDVSEDRLRDVSQHPQFKPIACDVADANRIVAAFADIAFASGSLDALICCAGVLRIGPLETMSVEDFDQVFAVNTRGTWLCVREALPLLRKSATSAQPARVVLLSSVARAAAEDPGRRLCRLEGGGCRISAACWQPKSRGSFVLVNALAPGTVDTPMIHAVSDASQTGRYRPSGASPIGRIATADDVVDVIGFLLSDASRYVTGTTIPVDGGTQARVHPAGGRLTVGPGWRRRTPVRCGWIRRGWGRWLLAALLLAAALPARRRSAC